MDGKDNKKMNAQNERNEKREKLFNTSLKARELRERLLNENCDNERICLFLATRPLNYYIRIIYGLQDDRLLSFQEWKNEGYTVRKGEHGHAFWGQPRNAKQAAAPFSADENPMMVNASGDTAADGEAEKYKFYPLCFLFDEKQVYRRDADAADGEVKKQKSENYECVEM